MEDDSQDGRKQTTSSKMAAPDEDEIKDVLRGKFNPLPKLPSNLIRVYLASTATDMAVERCYLLKHMVPELREYCRQTYDIEFQLVDLRQGSVAEDPGSAALRLHQLSFCQSLSMGPTVLILVGQRYGPCMIPDSIAAFEFEEIRSCVQSPDQTVLLDTWYSRDDNSIPPEYNLCRDWTKDGVLRYETEAELGQALRDGVRRCVQIGKLDTEAERKYFISEIDYEVEQAVMADPHANRRCLFFQRLIGNINFSHEKVGRFVDITRKGQVDAHAKNNLQQITDHRIPSKLHSSNIHKFSVWWSDEGGINETAHAQYLQDLATSVDKSLRKQIDDAMRGIKKMDQTELYHEALNHAHMCVTKTSRLFSRDRALQKVRQYLLDDVRQPLTVHGNSGVGKSTLLAKTASLVSLWFEEEPSRPFVLVRFLGNTPASSSVDSTLRSLCAQMTAVFEVPDITLPLDLNELTEHFLQLLQNVPSSSTLVLLLDAIDELVEADVASAVQWVPTRLPVNVKMVLTTRDNGHGSAVINDLMKMNISKRHFLPVHPIDYDTCQTMLRSWVTNSRRNLTTEQWRLVDSAVSDGCTPLYLKLILNLIISWKSSATPDRIPKDLNEFIDEFLDSLEKGHDRKLVRTAIGIMALSKFGVTEAELDDMFSLDDQTLIEVFGVCIPLTRRLPTVIWSRLSYDLRYYITRRLVDGAMVITWSHSIFTEHCQKKFLSNWVTATGHRAKNLLIDYFSGRWAEEEKPFKVTKEQQRLLGLERSQLAAFRYVPRQPTVSYRITSDSRRSWTVNRRKVRLLSTILCQDARYWNNEEALYRFMRLVPFNFEMLIALLMMGEWNRLMSILGAREAIDDEDGEFEKRQIWVLTRSLFFVREHLVRNPSTVVPYIVGQFLGNFNFLTHPSALIRQADTEMGRQFCALIPAQQHLPMGGGIEYLNTGRHVGPVRDCCYVGNALYCISDKLIGVSFDGSGRRTGILVNTKIAGVPEGDYFQSIQHFTLSTQSQVSVNPDVENLSANAQLLLSLRHEPMIFFVSASDGRLLRTVDCRNDFPSNQKQEVIKNISVISVLGYGTMLHVSFVNSPLVLVYSSDKGKCMQSLEARDDVLDVAMMSDESHCMLLANGDIVSLDGVEYDQNHCTDLGSMRFSTVKCEHKLSCWNKGKWGLRTNDTIAVGLATGDITVYFGINPFQTQKIPPISTTVHLPDGAVPHHIDCDTKGVRLRYSFVIVCTDKNVHLLKFEIGRNKKCSATVLTTVGRQYEQAFLLDEIVVAYQSNAVYVASIADNYTIKPVATVDAHYSPIIKVKLSHIVSGTAPNRLVVTIAEDGSCAAFNMAAVLRSQKHLSHFDRMGGPVIAMETGCSLAITLEANDGVACVWDIATGKIMKHLCHSHPVHRVCLSSSERYVASIDSSDTLSFWDLLSHSKNIQVSKATLTYDLKGNEHWMFAWGEYFFIASDKGQYVSIHTKSKQIGLRDPHHVPRPLSNVALSSGGEVLALGAGGTVANVTDPLTGRELNRFDLSAKTGLSLSKYGNRIWKIGVWGSNTILLIGDVLLCHKYVSNSIFPLRKDMESDATFASAGSTLVLVNKGQISSLTDLNGTWQHYPFAVEDNMFKVTEDGKYVICVEHSRTLKLLRVADGSELASFCFLVQITTLNLTNDGWFVVLGGADGRMYSYVIADPDDKSHDDRISGLPSRQQPFILQIERPHDPRYKALRDFTASLETSSFADTDKESYPDSEDLSDYSSSDYNDDDDGDDDEHETSDMESRYTDQSECSDDDVIFMQETARSPSNREHSVKTIPQEPAQDSEDNRKPKKERVFLPLPNGTMCLAPVSYRPPTLQDGYKDRMRKLSSQFTDVSISKGSGTTSLSDVRSVWTAPVTRDPRQTNYSHLRSISWRYGHTLSSRTKSADDLTVTSRACVIS